jgi:hypothetical protein
MMEWPQYSSVAAPLPKTVRFCKVCHQHTPHEIRPGGGLTATICVPCLERALTYELDRE